MLPLICLDPGHGTAPAVAVQREPIAPGSSVLKVKDGGGAPGEGPVVLAIARRTKAELERRGLRVVMTRTGPGYRGGNIARARFCNRRGAALMLRIHADGSSDPSRRGVATLYPAAEAGGHAGKAGMAFCRHRKRCRAASLRAARLVQGAVVRTTGAPDLGLVARRDLTGFNWARVPVILVETGFLTNPAERLLLHSPPYQARIARGLAAGARAFVSP